MMSSLLLDNHNNNNIVVDDPLRSRNNNTVADDAAPIVWDSDTTTTNPFTFWKVLRSNIMECCIPKQKKRNETSRGLAWGYVRNISRNAPVRTRCYHGGTVIFRYESQCDTGGNSNCRRDVRCHDETMDVAAYVYDRGMECHSDGTVFECICTILYRKEKVDCNELSILLYWKWKTYKIYKYICIIKRKM